MYVLCRRPLDYERVPELGYCDAIDAVNHLMCFALNLMTSGRIDDVVDAEYINSLEWYRTLPDILAGEVDKDDGVAARGEGHLHFPQ